MGTIPILIFAGIFFVALGVVLWALLQDAFINIKPGEIGLVINRGRPADKGLPPGVHFALRFGRVIEIYPSVEMAYLTLPESDRASTPESMLTFVDPPLPVSLGDKTAAVVQYTVRVRLTSPGLPMIHTRFGPAGLKSAIRDESRSVIVEALGDEETSAANVVGAARESIEQKISAALGARLEACGFEMRMFTLRHVDLGATGEVIQATLRASQELERERARGAVRALRAEQEAQVHAALADTLDTATLEYLRVQATRDLIERWDGKLLSPAASGGAFPGEGEAPLSPSSPPSSDVEPPPDPGAAAP